MENNEQSVKEIQKAMDEWAEVLSQKDLENMHKDYSNQYCLFDVKETVKNVD